MRLSKNFTLREMTKSQTATRLGIDNQPNATQVQSLTLVCLNIIQPVRDEFGIPFTPSSGFRSAELCEAIGSNKTSQHAKGEAVDFEVPSLSNYELAQWIVSNLNFDQLILEHYTDGNPNSGWVHCSYKKTGNRNQVLRYDGKHYKNGL